MNDDETWPPVRRRLFSRGLLWWLGAVAVIVLAVVLIVTR